MSGDDNWEELQDDLSDLANIAGYGQRADTNSLLRKQLKETNRIKSLPQCWHCGGRLELRGAKICPHCRTELKWLKIKGQSGSFTPSEKKAYGIKTAKEQKARATSKRQNKQYGKNKVKVARYADKLRSNCYRVIQCIVFFLFLAFLANGAFVAIASYFDYEATFAPYKFALLVGLPILFLLLVRAEETSIDDILQCRSFVLWMDVGLSGTQHLFWIYAILQFCRGIQRTFNGQAGAGRFLVEIDFYLLITLPGLASLLLAIAIKQTPLGRWLSQNSATP